MTPCPYCHGPKRNALWPTCGDPSCRDAHRKGRKAASARDRYAVLKESGMCPRDGRPIAKRPSKVTGQPVISRCASCLRAQAETGRIARQRRRDAADKMAALGRLAAAQIERRRVEEARRARGLPASHASTPRVPKDAPTPTLEV